MNVKNAFENCHKLTSDFSRMIQKKSFANFTIPLLLPNNKVEFVVCIIQDG